MSGHTHIHHTCQLDVRKFRDIIIVEKSGISLTKAGQNFGEDIKLAEHYYCVACVLLYSYCSIFSPTVACLRHTTCVRILNAVYR